MLDVEVQRNFVHSIYYESMFHIPCFLRSLTNSLVGVLLLLCVWMLFLFYHFVCIQYTCGSYRGTPCASLRVSL